MKINFENIEQLFLNIAETKQYKLLVKKTKKAKKIFLLGNGGLHFVANHMSTDLTRLIEDKVAYSFDSAGFITSNANDHGFENLFVRWLDVTATCETSNECLIIGLSCSGNSSNVINALHWGRDNGYETFMISGQKSEILDDSIEELYYGCQYFHTAEVLCMMIFYDLIYKTGNHCPSIKGEKNRLKDSPLRGKEQKCS